MSINNFYILKNKLLESLNLENWKTENVLIEKLISDIKLTQEQDIVYNNTKAMALLLNSMTFCSIQRNFEAKQLYFF